MSELKIKWETENDQGEEVVIEFPGKYRVCPTCGGKGTAMTKTLRESAFTREDFENDPDFAEMYFNGGYDATCDECDGERVILVLDLEAARREKPSELKAFLEFTREMKALDDVERQERERGA
jgi:hypothetical protein